ncbi:MAG: hypothetical protein AB1633_00135 [Elusimicrobiota bacterium]
MKNKFLNALALLAEETSYQTIKTACLSEASLPIFTVGAIVSEALRKCLK